MYFFPSTFILGRSLRRGEFCECLVNECMGEGIDAVVVNESRVLSRLGFFLISAVVLLFFESFRVVR